MLSTLEDWLRGLPGPLDRLVRDLGVEAGTLTTFFSRTHPDRGRLEEHETRVEQASGDSLVLQSRFLLRGCRDDEIRMRVRDTLERTENGFGRIVRFDAEAGSLVRDMVSRYVLDAEDARVTVGGRTFSHRGSNRYLQFPCAPSRIRARGAEVRVETSFEAGGDAMEGLVYFRDEPAADYRPGPWIFHERWMARRRDRTATNYAWRLGSGTVPETVHRLLEGAGAHRALMDARERTSPRLPVQTVGAALLEEDASFVIRSCWTVGEPDGG